MGLAIPLESRGSRSGGPTEARPRRISLAARSRADRRRCWPACGSPDGPRGLGVVGIALAASRKARIATAAARLSSFPAAKPFRLAPRDPALYFVQRLRDEAHRFAIGTHRARRKKEFTKSPLDEIGGIGPVRKRALLNAFGTAKALSRASLGDLERVPGVNAATARLVYDYFHEKR